MIFSNHRTRSNANASLLSMVQRFSDISIIFIGIYVACLLNGESVQYKHILIFLTVLVIFQMIGGITDFYRSWRGVDLSAEIILIFKNWTLSLLLSLGGFSLLTDLNIDYIIFLQWFFIVCFGFFVCRLSIRIILGMLRKIGYNTRKVAVAGSLPAGLNLLRTFQNAPWLGFVVKGIYDDIKIDSYEDVPYGGTLSELVEDARSGKIDRIYIAMSGFVE